MSYKNATSIPTHFGDTRLSTIGPRERRLGYSPIEYRLTYINHLPTEVTVVWRSGLRFTLKPIPNLQSSVLIARVEIILQPSVKVDIERVLSVVTESASPELKAMRENFQLQIQNNTYGGATLLLDYPLTLDQLQEYGGTIYYSELDCVVSLLPLTEAPPHPYSEEGLREQIVAGCLVNHSEVGFGYSIEIVDNASRYGDRFLNVGNKVYKVSPKKDIHRRDGIYIVYNHAGKDGVKLDHYPFEGAEEALGLYRTHEEAFHCGDVSTARKHQIATLEHEISLHKHESQKARQEHEREMIEKDKELKQLIMDHEKRTKEMEEHYDKIARERELERHRIKDQYEDRSYDRKDQSETIKFLPTIIVGVGAFFMAMRTLLSK